MKLIFLLQRDRWFIENSNIWYSIRDTDEQELAFSVLPLLCMDEYEMCDQPVQAGHVAFERLADDRLKICLINKHGETDLEKEITLDKNLLAVVDWDEPPFPDGWVSSTVRLNLEHVSECTLQLFLPDSPVSESKILKIRDQHGSFQEYLLNRGEETTCAIVNNQTPGNHQLLLDCEPEPSADSSDVRSLGFVLANSIITV